MMQHDDVKDVLAAYALGAVTPEEKRAVDVHLMSCDDCRREVADYEEATGALALAVEPTALPPGFAERVVSAATADRKVVDAPELRKRWRRFAVFAGVAVMAVAIAVGGSIVESREDAARREQVLALLSSGEGISLTGDDDVIARVAGSRFAIAGVDEAPEGKTYQLWLMRGPACPSVEPAECELVSAGTFDAEDGVALVELERSAADWEDAAVTVEPEEGSDVPTTDPFVHSL